MLQAAEFCFGVWRMLRCNGCSYNPLAVGFSFQAGRAALTLSSVSTKFLAVSLHSLRGTLMSTTSPGLYLSSTGGYPRVGDTPELQWLQQTIAAMDAGDRTTADLLDAQNAVTRQAIAAQVSGRAGRRHRRPNSLERSDLLPRQQTR